MSRDKSAAGSRSASRELVKKSYRWHRRLGILAALPAVFLALTGLMLNHAKLLSLDEIKISNSWVLDWYGMEPPHPPLGLKLGQHWIGQLADALYFNERRIAAGVSKLRGAGESGGQIFLADRDSLLIVDAASGELIEELNEAALPAGQIQALQVDAEGVWLASGGEVYRALPDELEFLPTKGRRVEAATLRALPKPLERRIVEDWRGRGLSLWRVILDFHSGIFFGALGRWVMDLAAFAILFLVLSGVYNWRSRPVR